MRFKFRPLATIAVLTASGLTYAQSSGTAFVVAPGLLVTNHHVIDGCGAIDVIASDGRRPATVVDSVGQIDLALLRVYGLRGGIATLRTKSAAMLGESATVFGFPLGGALSSTGNFTTGVVSSLRGMRDAAGEIQFTAPVQPGNSGGPVLDRAGAVIGVVQGKLDALRAVRATGDIPQNVNFAVALDVLADFLVKNSVPLKEVGRQAAIETTQIAEMALTFTYKIVCSKGTRTAGTPRAPAPTPTVPDTALPDKLVQDIQTVLNQKGFQSGPADGFIGPQTRAAIRKAQGQLGLAVTGEPSNELLNRLPNLPRSVTSSDQVASASWDPICSNTSPNQLSNLVRQYIGHGAGSQTQTFTQTASGSRLSNPTVTWSLSIDVHGMPLSFYLVRTSGNNNFDLAVKSAIQSVLRCSPSRERRLPNIEFTYSLF